MEPERYSSRFLQTDGLPLTLEEVSALVCSNILEYSCDRNLLFWDGSPFGKLDSWASSTPAFEDHVELLWRGFEESTKHSRNPDQIKKQLQNCVGIIRIDTPWPHERDKQREMFERLDPVWDVFFEFLEGMVLVDYGWYSDKDGPI